MKRIQYLLILPLLLLSCDSVDQPERDFSIITEINDEPKSKAIEIMVLYWENFKISSQDKYFHDENRSVDKKTAEELIKKSLNDCVPEANVIITISTASWLKNFDQGILNIENWLISLGFDKITFIVEYKDKKEIFREYNKGEVKVIEKDESEFDNLTLEQKWKRIILDEIELSKLYEATKKEAFEKLGPILFDIVYPSQGISLYGGPPPEWTDTKQSYSFRRRRIAEKLWALKVRSGNKAEVAAIILKLLKNAKTDDQKEQMILTLMFHQWNSECEEALRNFASNELEGFRARNHAMRTLLKRCGTEKYIPICIEITIKMTDTTRKCISYNEISREINNFSKLSKENANLMIKSGFKILTELKDEDLKHGYNVASTLGGYLKIKNNFKPDLNDPMYAGINHDYFYPDTVKNALKWWDENKHLYN